VGYTSVGRRNEPGRFALSTNSSTRMRTKGCECCN
jgi:hypothetical protein